MSVSEGDGAHSCGDCRHWGGSLDSPGPPWEQKVEECGGPQACWGRCERAGNCQPEGQRFYCQDKEDYSAWLETRSDFGCVDWEAKAPTGG